MANVASAEKRNRQRLKRRERNLQHLTPMRTLVKRARVALNSSKETPETVAEAVTAATKKLARAASKGVIHKKTASRKISRLAKAANKAKTATPAAKKTATKAGAKKPAAKAAPVAKSTKAPEKVTETKAPEKVTETKAVKAAEPKTEAKPKAAKPKAETTEKAPAKKAPAKKA